MTWRSKLPLGILVVGLLFWAFKDASGFATGMGAVGSMIGWIGDGCASIVRGLVSILPKGK